MLGHFHKGNGDHYVCLDADGDDIQEVVAARDQLSWSSTSQIVAMLSIVNRNRAFAALADEVVNDMPVLLNNFFFVHHKLALLLMWKVQNVLDYINKRFRAPNYQSTK